MGAHLGFRVAAAFIDLCYEEGCMTFALVCPFLAMKFRCKIANQVLWKRCKRSCIRKRRREANSTLCDFMREEFSLSSAFNALN